ncbi:MAG: 6,7-dimethyl-8-ribityllumazine synthase [Saprospiraceae bacterium]|nr:6,7-dimethyl-8-ribityllumazine synthase [Saprospiraceae bacterium]
MSSSRRSLSALPESGIPKAEDFHFGLVVSAWNDDITGSMAEAARDTLLHYGVMPDNIIRIEVPGAYELPMGARILAGREKLDAIICIGCVIRGETAHNEYINNAVAQGLMQFSLMSGIPAIFGVLTPNDHQQALDRAGGQHGNKGVEAALTALRMADLKKKNKEKTPIGFGQNPA